MSGFGGGGPFGAAPFGSSQQQPQQQQQQQPFFGTSNTLQFGAASTAATAATSNPLFGGGGGGGFGAAPAAAPILFGGGGGGGVPSVPIAASTSIFGSQSSTSTAFGASSTFGTTASTTFGTNTNPNAVAAAPAMTFGSSPNVWNNNNQQQQQQAPNTFGSSFGSSSNSIFSNTGFGTSNINTTTSSATAPSSGGGFAFGTSSGFGSTPAAPAPAAAPSFFGGGAATFGNTNNNNNSFAAAATAGPFGSANNNNITITGGIQQNQPFGTSFGGASNINNNAPASFLTVPNPFGAAAATQQQQAVAAGPLLSFGMSSNVATDADNIMSGSLSPTPFFSNGGGGGGGFGGGGGGGGGGMSPFGSPMQQHSDNEDMGFGDDNINNYNYNSNSDTHVASSNLPFGTPASTWPPPPAAPFASNQNSSSLSPIPEDDMAAAAGTGGADSSSPVPSSSDNDNNNNNINKPTSEQNELSKLKAKIEQKKKRLEEKRRKDLAKAQQAAASAVAGASGGGGGTSSLNPNARSFAPSSSSGGGGQHRQQQQQQQDYSGDFKQYKDRNEDKMSKTRSQLPSDLLELADQSTDYAALTTSAMANREDLANAVSLVGKCLHMCPDEELLRRQREGDIQLLETPLPEILHPPGWTLRDTAVKRFRRSAADYKLDVPEWIRPPDVLEKVCGYLEEWIMERDRQGPDPRWSGGASPPSLDVYQFIWDRTRMVRKDFILQNYVGTGGNCDARAVRCHERIARWHAMCEHQLSHIPEFVTQQSQQNIQELGQTMKTLNQYYDDALGRSRVEVPDEAGNETRTDTRGYSHGCSCDIVQGQDPVDFDESPLANNTETIKRRLIGNSENHGTAEAEMRGLYMLLTIDNDGGMEVLKYAAQLHRERPDIYQSRHVQLALSIYKAKKEDNYARFFRILRSSSTPYLFACIMFKHVEYMRKHAIFVMSRTFGGVTKDTKEPMYDHYPLKELIRLLCFEDAEEAMAALQHYNITVKEMKVRMSSTTKTEYFVFWKRSVFKEARHPEKGFALPLYPKKMMRTIETKLRGATRLAVCRGELSEVVPEARGSRRGTSAAGASAVGQDADSFDAEALLAQQREDEEREQIEAAKLAEEERLRRQQAKMEERRLVQESQQRAIAEKKLREEEERQKQRELELEQQRLQKAREEAELQARQERVRQLEIKRQEAERKRAEEEEHQRRIKIERQEAERKKAEEERQQEIERVRQEAERRRLEEEQRRQEAELAERRRLELEARQKELARLEEQRKKREALERKETLEWDERTRKATSMLLWRRLKRRLPRHLQVMSDAQTSIRRLGSPAPENYQMVLDRAVSSMAIATQSTYRDPPVASLRIVIDRLLRQEVKRKSLASMLLPAFSSRISSWRQRSPSLDYEKPTFLFKIAIILPETGNSRDQSLCALIREWIALRLGGFGHVELAASALCRVGVVIVDGSDPEYRDACDASLVVVPLSLDHGIDESIHSLMHILDDDTPRVFLALAQRFNGDLEQAGQDIEDALSGSFDDIAVLSNSELSEEAMEDSLLTAAEAVLSALIKTRPKVIDQVPLDQLCLMCISETMWLPDHFDCRDDLVTLVKDTLACMVEQLDAMGTMAESEWRWPPPEFADATGSVVKDYFGDSMHLPMIWTSSLLRRNVEPSVAQLQNRIDGTLPEAIRNLLTSAPHDVQEECRLLLDNRCFRRCFQRALMWKSENQEPWQSESYVYIPQNLVRGIVQKTAAAMKAAVRLLTIMPRPSSRHVGEMWDERNYFGPVDGSFLETIDLPPMDSPQPRIQGTANVSESRTGAVGKRSRNAAPEEVRTDELSNQPGAADNISAASKRGVRDDDVRWAVDDDDTNNKRRRRSTDAGKRSSRVLEESKSFTKRLQAMVAGNVLHDRMIGKQSLSVLLRNSDINLPDSET